MVQLKYAIVDLFERDEVDIVETKHIITQCDRAAMNGENWDRKEEVQIPWPFTRASSKKQLKYVARILRCGDDKQELSMYMEAALDGKEIPMNGDLEFGRGKRSKQPKRTNSFSSNSECDTSVDETPTDRQQNKKKKRTHRSVDDDSRELLRAKLATVQSESSEKFEIDKLREKVKMLTEENQSLRNALRLINGIPDLIEKVEQLGSSINQVDQRRFAQRPDCSPMGRSTPVPSTPSRDSPALHSSPSQSRPCTPTQSRPSTPTNGRLKKVVDYDVDEDGKVDLGHGTFVKAHNLQYVSCQNSTKATYTLCEVVFTRDELANSSLTGKKSNAFVGNETKPMLNANGIDAIIDFVTRKFPSEDARSVKRTVGKKLNIMQKMSKRN